MLDRPALDRDTHRALVEAGIAPLQEYVGRYDMSDATADPIGVPQDVLDAFLECDGSLVASLSAALRKQKEAAEHERLKTDWWVTPGELNDTARIAALEEENERLRGALRDCVYRLQMSQEELRILNEELGRADDEQNMAADEGDSECLSRARAALGDKP